MPFTPKFVDLVRNYTTTTGSGNLVLGQAVNGFTGFAAAVQPGDQFYYSVIGVDKPQEREVGRGTMQANGSIAREAISGSLTNFTNGTKTVALIAAAEWFDKVEAGSGGAASDAPVHVASRTALAALPTTATALLIEPGREGLFVFDATNLSAKVTADPRQGIYVAPASAPTGASGAWVRKYDGPVNVKWFGAVANFVTDDLPAFAAAHDLIKATGPLGAGNALYIPQGLYYLSDTWDLHVTLHVVGPGANQGDGGTAILRFGKNCNGIVVNNGNTHGNTTGSQGSASGTVIEGLKLWGGNVNVDGAGNVTSYSAGDSLTGHGIRIRTTFVGVRDVTCSFFGEDGFNLVGIAGSGGATEGLPDSFHLSKCHAIYNGRYGFYTNGDNANAGTIDGSCSAISNAGCGFYETSFLGNSYIQCHARDNGYTNPVIPGGPTGVCTFGGNTYFASADPSKQALASTTTPGTDPTVWKPATGTPYAVIGSKAWVTGQTWYAPGAYATNPGNQNAANVFMGCYAEAGQAPVQGSYPTLFLGGLISASIGFDKIGPHTIGGIEAGNSHVGVPALRTYGIVDANIQTSVGTDDGATLLKHQHTAGGANYRFYRDPNWGGFGYKALTSQLDNVFTAKLVGLEAGFLYGGLGGTVISKLYAGDGSVNNAKAIRPFGALSELNGLVMQVGDLFWHVNAGTGADCLFMCTTAGTYGSGAVLEVLAKRGGAGGGGLLDGDKGDVVVGGGGTTLTVESATPADGTFDVAGNIKGTGWLYYQNVGSMGLFRDRGGSVEVAAFNAAGSAEAPFELVGSRIDMMLVSGGAYKARVNSTGLDVQGTVVATGAISGSNLSGTNTGDQTISLTGDVTGTGTGSFAATIGNDRVTYAKLQNVSAASRILGRGSAGGAGDPEELSIGSGLTISGTTLDAAAVVKTGGWTELTLTSDFTCANSTAFNDITDGSTAFSYTPPASSSFEIQAVLLIQTATATNLPRVGVSVAAQGSGAFGSVQIDQTGASLTTRVNQDGSFTTAAVNVQVPAGGLATANEPYMAYVTIRGRSGASPAAIKLQAACETAAANTCFVKAGSQMRTKAS